MRVDILGSDHHLTQVAANHLAICLLEVVRRNLFFVQKALRNQVNLSHMSFCSDLFGQGQIEEALAHAIPLYSARQKQLGNTHPDTVSSATTLASCYQALGKVGKTQCQLCCN